MSCKTANLGLCFAALTLLGVQTAAAYTHVRHSGAHAGADQRIEQLPSLNYSSYDLADDDDGPDDFGADVAAMAGGQTRIGGAVWIASSARCSASGVCPRTLTCRCNR